VTREQVLVSAHRCGAGKNEALENTRVALDRSLALGVDYVELDVRRLGDGTLVLFHDPWLVEDGKQLRLNQLTLEEFAGRSPQYLLFEDALSVIDGRARVHLDLKFRSPSSAYADPASTYEVGVAARAVELLGADGLIVTTGNIRAIRAVRDWADHKGLDVRAGLSIGSTVAGRPLREQVRERRDELFPGARIASSRANAVVANHWLAMLGLARFARRAGIPLLVWTVDNPLLLRYWLKPGRAWAVTTNLPERAMAIRDGRMHR
jgi:glycerophosphoryl diester phosphodiesterase